METRNEMTMRWLKETTEMSERHSAEREAQLKRWDKEEAELEKPEEEKEFEFSTSYAGTLKIRIDSGNEIVFTLPNCGSATFNIAEAIDVYQKLGQLIDEAKAKGE